MGAAAVLSDRSEDGAAPITPALTTPQQWRSYLREYSKLHLRAAGNADERGGLAAEQVTPRWLGYEPAAEQTVAAAEQRLAVQFPPSFRNFLLTSDGWPGVGDWVDALYSCDNLAWFRDTDEGGTAIDVAEVFFGEPDEEDEDEDDPSPPTVFERSLLVASGEDHWLLDPAKPGVDGEWTAWRYEVKAGELQRFASFAELFHFCREENNPVTQPDPGDMPAHSTGLALPMPNLAQALKPIRPGTVVPPDADGGEE
ncbi:SMI1/KNR4 family protein [Saccharopolyspora hattusasensis]|uniref:SMI1/KNR4 family protein n=1 Tax=Saccharopolyspora hattusasensis TaxID=1128679 RepID=UPI003D950F67